MTFAKRVFQVAGVWGLLIITPLYFILDQIGVQDPPPVTHPAFYYGFVGVSLAWQFAFFIIAKDPERYRAFIIPSVLMKIGYGGAIVVLYSQSRVHPTDLGFGIVDLAFAGLFLIAWSKLGKAEA
jgi:hypothetical protein